MLLTVGEARDVAARRKLTKSHILRCILPGRSIDVVYVQISQQSKDQSRVLDRKVVSENVAALLEQAAKCSQRSSTA